MKKTVIILVASVVALSMAPAAFAQTDYSRQFYPETDMVVGFSFPTIGSTQYNQYGRIDSLTGINAGLGYSWRNYFGDGVEMREWNGYLGAGTVAILVPYFEFGTTYTEPLGKQNDAVLAIDLGALYLLPYLSISLWF